jgi:hypothetical protein
MLGLLGILKNPLDNIKTIAFALFIGAALTYAGVLWVKNDSLTKDLAQKAIDLSEYKVANYALAKQLSDKEKERKRLDDLLGQASADQKAATPIFIERKVYVETYRNDPTVTHCDLDDKWVSAANAAVANPYRMSSSSSASSVGLHTAGSVNK